MSPFRNGNILSTPSRFIRKCEINLQNFNFCKHCYIRCHKNCVQDVHLMLHPNSHLLLVKYWKKCRLLCYWTPCLSSTSVLINQKDTIFSWSAPILFLLHQSNVKDHSCLLAMDYIRKNKKQCLYMHKKNYHKTFQVF